MQNTRWLLLLLIAVMVGAVIGLVDTRPHWDDTGLTVGMLVLASGLFGFAHPRSACLVPQGG
jgi:hypothetical protein